MAKIYLKRDKNFLVLCDEEGNIFENQYVIETKVIGDEGEWPRVEITFLLPEGYEHIASKYLKVQDL